MLYSYVNVHNMCNYAQTLELVYTLFLCPFPQLKYQACTTLTLSDCPVFISVRPAVNSLSFWVLFRRSWARSLLLDWSVCVCSRQRIRDHSEAFLHLYPLHNSSHLSVSHHHSPSRSLCLSDTLMFYLHALNHSCSREDFFCMRNIQMSYQIESQN